MNSNASTPASGGSPTPWRCRHGWHNMAFESMTEPYGSAINVWTCTLVERCRRCGLRTTNPMARPPKRVKVQ